MVQCQILIRAAVLGRLRLLSSQYFKWAVLTLRELVPLSRVDTSELIVRADVQPTGIAELQDLVLEEVAALVGRVQGRVVLVLERAQMAHVDEYIRVLATWCQEHALDVGSSDILPEPARTMGFSSRSPMDHHQQWLSLHIRYLSST